MDQRGPFFGGAAVSILLLDFAARHPSYAPGFQLRHRVNPSLTLYDLTGWTKLSMASLVRKMAV